MPESANDCLDFEAAFSAAEELLSAFRAGEDHAIDRVHQHLPQVKFGGRKRAVDFPLTLPDSQTIIARERGMQSWGELRLQIKLRDHDFGDMLEQLKQFVYAQDADKLDVLLTANPEVRSTLNDPHFYFGSTALIVAKENQDVVDVLLKHGADINAKSQWWAGDFHILEVASAEVAQQLIKRGAEITVHSAAEQGWLPWLEAAYERDNTIIHQRGGDGKTPLHYASDSEVLDWLIERGADLEARDLDHASTPLQWQLGSRNFAAARKLAGRGAQVDIFAAVILGDLSLVANELERHPNAIRARVNSAGYDLAPKADGSHMYVFTFNAAGLSPHQVALEYGHAEIFAYLVEQSPPDVKLLAFCAQANEEAARRVVAEDPDVVAQMPEADRRQLIHAAWTNNVASVRLMAELGFDLHVYDDDRMMPVHSAAFHGFADVIEILLDADAAPPLAWLNSYGGTPLSTCLYGRNHSWRDDGDFPASIKLLVEAGSEVRAEWLPSGDDAIDDIFRRALESTG